MLTMGIPEGIIAVLLHTVSRATGNSRLESEKFLPLSEKFPLSKTLDHPTS